MKKIETKKSHVSGNKKFSMQNTPSVKIFIFSFDSKWEPPSLTVDELLNYIYIYMKMGKELDALEKICPEISQKFENYIANEIVKLLVCSMWGDR